MPYQLFDTIVQRHVAAQLYKIILNISNDKNLMMATTGRNM